MKIYYVNVSLRVADSEDVDAESNAVEIDDETIRVDDDPDQAYTDYQGALYPLRRE